MVEPRTENNTATGRWSKRYVHRGPRQRTLCYLGELNDSAQVRWLKTIEVFNENGETQQLKLFPSEVEPPADDPDVAQVQLQKYGWNAHGSLGPAIWAGSHSSD